MAGRPEPASFGPGGGMPPPPPGFVPPPLARFDEDGDGSLSDAEWKKAREELDKMSGGGTSLDGPAGAPAGGLPPGFGPGGPPQGFGPGRPGGLPPGGPFGGRERD